jgi:excinuclease UvrABC ATPase subunit
MVDSILTLPESEKIMILAPVVQNRKGSHTKMLDELSNQGFLLKIIWARVQLKNNRIPHKKT